MTARNQVGEERLQEIAEVLELKQVWDRDVDLLSGGELQRFAIAMVCVQKADVYMFDEPSSFLDVKQRLAASRMIRSLLRPDCYVIVVEHDLAVLDYLSDYICVLYGKPAVYGVVTAPFSVREGINIFLDGIASQEGRIFIMTTNYKNRLDPALLRPGRVDKSIVFPLASINQTRRMFVRYYFNYLYSI